MRPFKLQYLHIYIHTYTQIGYMSAYYVHITNIHLYTIHTHTYADNVCLLYVYIVLYARIHTHNTYTHVPYIEYIH